VLRGLVARRLRSGLGLSDLPPERLGGQDELANQLLQALDLLAVALADVPEVGFQAAQGGRHLGFARTATSVRRRRAPERSARDLPQAPAPASRLRNRDCRSGLVIGGHRRMLAGIMAQCCGPPRDCSRLPDSLAGTPIRVNELPQRSQPNVRGGVCVVIAGSDPQERLGRCLESVEAHSAASTRLLIVPATATAVNRALEQLAPADVVVLDEACCVTEGWLERLRDAARSDSNNATASALADTGTALALCVEGDVDLADLADGLAERTLKLLPRLSRPVGPCIYVRREALELVGPLDDELDLGAALEIDFAQRCLLSGLAHVAADDVVVRRLAPSRRAASDQVPPRLLERYPYLSESPPLAESAVLAHALEVARGPRSRLSVTLDARALDGAVTGTQVHILELIVALAQTGTLRLRLLVREERIDRETLERLRALPETELLAEAQVDQDTPKSTVFHRPQQAFAPEDVEFALRLGERIVLSQLDLIAYRNPGYFPDAASWEDYRRASRHGLSAAERVVVFSDHTRRELLSDALVEDARIRIVPPGLDHRIPGEPRRPGALDDDDGGSLAAGFLLCLGTDFRHKNRLFALRLLNSLREQHDWPGSLVLAGTHIPHGSSLDLEQAFLEEHDGLREAVVSLGSVEEQEKAWLVANAAAVVYPSVYEGFGLVPFESALSGVPCIFAAQSSLAETAPEGTATILPWDTAQSAERAYALLTNPDVRRQHVQALARAAEGLTWAASAGAMVEVYREAASAPVRDAATLSRDAVERERRLTAAHEVVVRRLIGEREHARRMYDDLNAEVGSGLSLIGPHGTLPETVQRALLTLSGRPALSRPLYGALSYMFLGARALGRAVRAVLPRSR
jgi:glycosyltransferase involved in cell wall biosynthesis